MAQSVATLAGEVWQVRFRDCCNALLQLLFTWKARHVEIKGQATCLQHLLSGHMLMSDQRAIAAQLTAFDVLA